MTVSIENQTKLLKYLVARQIRFMRPSDLRRSIGNAAKESGVPIEDIEEIVETVIREEAEDMISQLRPQNKASGGR